MKIQERKVIINSAVASVVVGVLIFILLVSFAPDATPYSVNNFGWNGLHSVSSEYSIQEIGALNNAPISNGTLLIVAPVNNFSNSDSLFLRQFVQYGGRLVIADSYGYSNSLLSEMGIGIQVENKIVLDPAYNWKGSSYPIAFVGASLEKEFSFLSNVSGVALSIPRPLTITSPAASVIATSSAQSVEVTSTQNNSKTSSVHGPFPLIAAESIGKGVVLVIGDSSLLTNSVWTSANNRILINNLFSDNRVYLDTSHWPSNTETSLKAEFSLAYEQLSAAPLRYIFALAFVGAAALLIPAFTSVASLGKRTGEKAVGKFNNDALIRVRRDREKYGIQID